MPSDSTRPSPRDPIALVEPVAGVALWWCDLEERRRDVAALSLHLSTSEHDRAARFGADSLRQRWIAGRATLRMLLAEVLGCAPHQVPLRRGRRGRPEVGIDGAPDFNVTHTAGVALIAIGEGLARDTRIGVDIERVDRDVNADRLARKFLTSGERATLQDLDADARRRHFLRTWTCKEAMSKATGDGLIAPFRELDVLLGDPPRLMCGPPPYEPKQWKLLNLAVPRDFFASAALWSPQ